LKRGLSLKEVARRIGANFSSVFRWQQAHRKGGDAGLKAKAVPGRPKRLKPAQCRRLIAILLKGARAWGFPNELWTLKRIARVIRKKFGLVYHPCHVWKLLRLAGWSCQVPERRAIRRDEEAIAHWKRYKWPALKKSATTGCPPRFP